MKILADENIPRITLEVLRAAGHDVRDLRGTSKQGVPDQDLWEIAIEERLESLSIYPGHERFEYLLRYDTRHFNNYCTGVP